MQFNSLGFLIFFPAAAGLYFLMPGKLRSFWLLLVSYGFYMSKNPLYVAALLFSTGITYAAGFLLERENKAEKEPEDERNRKGSTARKRKKQILAGTVVLNLLLLFFFKYFDFFLGNVNFFRQKMGASFWENPFDLLLPLGISYYTLQVIAYLVDIYKGKIQAEKNFLHYALFVSFFPKVVSGPIERAENLLPQIRACEKKPLWDWERVTGGLTLMLWGYFQKMVLADRVCILVNTVFDQYFMYGSVELIAAALGFYIQIFCDFAGYTNIALGMAQVMGFSLQENFDAPYFARSIKEFWRRWHISLSLFLRDYIYIPLGGNRKGRVRKYCNIMITFLASGLWHGASWSFVIWGGLHGLYQIVEDITAPWVARINAILHTKTDSFGYKAMQTVKTFLLAAFAFIFFRAPSGAAGFSFIGRMVTRWNPWALFDGSLYQLGISDKYMHLLGILFFFLLIIESIRYKTGERIEEILKRQCIWFRWGVLAALFLAVIVFGAYGPAYSAENFIYFQF